MHCASGDIEAMAEVNDSRLAMMDPKREKEAFEAVASAYTGMGKKCENEVR